MPTKPDPKAFNQLFQRFESSSKWQMSYGDGEGTNGHRSISCQQAYQVIRDEMLFKGSNLAFFPLFYLMRHSIELSLKDSIVT